MRCLTTTVYSDIVIWMQSNRRKQYLAVFDRYYKDTRYMIEI